MGFAQHLNPQAPDCFVGPCRGLLAMRYEKRAHHSMRPIHSPQFTSGIAEIQAMADSRHASNISALHSGSSSSSSLHGALSTPW